MPIGSNKASYSKGAPGPNLYVAKEIEEDSFAIAGGKPGMEVSWQVTARRNDACMRAHPMVVGQEKPEGQHGRYLSPELFGAPKEMGMFYGGKGEKPSPDLIKSPRHHPNLPQLLQTRKN